ncbi:MAG: hypothetical protein KAU21_04085 [Gammaproteobacteria bacterium]|nr:hypothetical protein [Gammaproteobacteria bacterium]
MTLKTDKQLSFKLLIMLLISSLLFITSIELHIHTKDAAALADHGATVSITSVVSDSLPSGTGTEIKVSPDGVLKVKQNNINTLAIFILAIIMTIVFFKTGITRLIDFNSLIPKQPFHGTPLLRAPPVINS